MRGETDNEVFNAMWSSRAELYMKGDGQAPAHQTLVRSNESIREIYWALHEELDHGDD